MGGLSMGVLGVIFDVAGLSLGWVYLAMGVLIGSAVFPISSVLLVPWVTKNGAMGGAVLGLVFAIITWFCAALAEDCAEISIDCLGGDYPMLYGNLVAILGSTAITLLWSYLDGGRDNPYDFAETRAVKLID